jgi:hypothetical protein
MTTIHEAIDTIRAGRFEEGLARLTELAAATDGATRLEALGHRAWLLRSLGRLEEALRDYDALCAENPADLHAAATRAETMLLASQPHPALEAAAAILARDPAHDGAAAVLVRCRRELGLKPLPTPSPINYLPGGLDPARAGAPLARFPLWEVLRGRMRFPSRYDYYEDYLRRHAKGKRVIDIGAMWLVSGRFSFFAEECGAAEVVAFDTIEPSQEFLKERERRGSRVRYVHGDLMDENTFAHLGQFDVVFCCGVIYHLPDPALGCYRIRQLARESALIGTAVIGEGLGRNRAVYYPYLPPRRRRWWNYGSNETKFALDTPYQPAADYANWFWGMSPSCVAALLHTAGFAVEHIHYRRHFAYFECRV